MRPLSASLSIRISPTADSSSVCDTFRLHLGMLDDTWNGDDVVASHDQRPRLTLGSGNLGVDEHVLNLFPMAGEPVARPPAPYLKPWELGLDPPLAPANRTLEHNGAALEPEAVVLADELDSVAEIEAFRADRRRDQLGQS